jgi:predicted nicotinamide N-methyase
MTMDQETERYNPNTKTKQLFWRRNYLPISQRFVNNYIFPLDETHSVSIDQEFETTNCVWDASIVLSKYMLNENSFSKGKKGSKVLILLEIELLKKLQKVQEILIRSVILILLLGHFKDKVVLELGSGCGLSGIVAAFLGARTILTDLGDMISLLQRNVKKAKYHFTSLRTLNSIA